MDVHVLAVCITDYFVISIGLPTLSFPRRQFVFPPSTLLRVADLYLLETINHGWKSDRHCYFSAQVALKAQFNVLKLTLFYTASVSAYTACEKRNTSYCVCLVLGKTLHNTNRAGDHLQTTFSHNSGISDELSLQYLCLLFYVRSRY